MPHDNQHERATPVTVVNTGSAHDDPLTPEDGIALCLSGGGYRAMLFHVGSLWRLNELGMLPKLARISSVSGGSITAGVLGLKWRKLVFDANGVSAIFQREVVEPIRELADRTLDEGAILSGIFTPGSISDKVAKAYRTHLFGNATLQDLPPDPPRFVINATSVQSGALFRFSRPFAADYRVGQIVNPRIELAVAVAAVHDQLVLLTVGAESARVGPLSQQITALARKALPHAEIVTVNGTNHMMPLQDPDAVGRLIETFVTRHASRV